MKNNPLRLAGFLMLFFFSCEKWDYDAREFPEVLTTSIDAGNFNRTVAIGFVRVKRGTLEKAGHCWSNLNKRPTLRDAHTNLLANAINPDGTFESVMLELSTDSIFFLRAYVIFSLENNRDTVYENLVNDFMPVPLGITSTSIRLEGENARVISVVTGLADNTADTFGHCWSNDIQTPDINGSISQHSNLGKLEHDSIFEDYLPDLKIAKTYYIRAYATVNGKTYYGNMLQIFIGDKWVHKADFPLPLYGSIGFCLNEKIYIGLGHPTDNPNLEYRLWRYDPDTNNWTQVADFPGSPRESGVSFIVMGKAFVGLGKNDSTYLNDFYAYDFQLNQWVQKASFPGYNGFGLSDAVAFSIGNKGYTVCGNYDNQCWCYYPFESGNGFDQNGEPMGRWVKKANFGGSYRSSAVGFAIGNIGYVGTGIGSNFFNDFWEFHPEDLSNGLDEIGQPNGTWVRRSDIGVLGRGEALGFSLGNFGYIGGGYHADNNTGIGFSDWWRYNPLTDKWTSISIIPDGLAVSGVAIANKSRGYIYRLNFPHEPDFWEYIPFQ